MQKTVNVVRECERSSVLISYSLLNEWNADALAGWQSVCLSVWLQLFSKYHPSRLGGPFCWRFTGVQPSLFRFSARCGQVHNGGFAGCASTSSASSSCPAIRPIIIKASPVSANLSSYLMTCLLLSLLCREMKGPLLGSRDLSHSLDGPFLPVALSLSAAPQTGGYTL